MIAAKQDAAWKFAKFAAGPYGASVVVPGTGYVPNNELAAKSADYLGDFYKKNPLFQAGLEQMPLMIPWYAFPGTQRRQGHPDDRRQPVAHRRPVGHAEGSARRRRCRRRRHAAAQLIADL